MALTEAQKINCYMLLGIPYGKSSLINDKFDSVTTAEQDAIEAILTQYAGIQYDTDKIRAEGLDSDPGRTEKKLKRQLNGILGFSEPNKFSIGRG